MCTFPVGPCLLNVNNTYMSPVNDNGNNKYNQWENAMCSFNYVEKYFNECKVRSIKKILTALSVNCPLPILKKKKFYTTDILKAQEQP